MLTLPPRSEVRRRVPRLVAGLFACGVGFAFMVEAGLGLGPWEVLHQGISRRTGIPIGTVGILVGLVVLLGWLPLRQRLGVGTMLNVIIVGTTIDLTMLALPEPSSLAARWVLLAGGIWIVGLGSGLYIGAGLGPGPRDGLMTGIAARGPSVRATRTGIELAALAGGWLLGGTVGIGTVLFAVGIGPLVQLFLARLAVRALVPA